MESWTAQEWLFVIGVGIVILVAFVNRKKIASKLGGGGSRDGDTNVKRK